MPQEQVQRNAQQQPEQNDETVLTTRDQSQVQDLDAVLDDIESTLEGNAEEYVNSFVQKGGQ
ncbi:ubiquitin-like protein Pup [Bifidobacterium crudilactis]|jgi:prokaryotic ubiquitin-like protein Pup|uniref:Prokaryotic ubiquitin-like protein Pup n=1 Tax=Bifidobacterium crudilactis TaxID=327277 RepID=A0A971CZV4_9BIFI|nr:ubiquitin-like protein Pup [Bifidobacterium crudilactis]MCI1218353.1 ubiquitin-like protein Pup [Bifidobacterium crudilactis]MCI1636734.1 ubiquitin-like protein Pup [Bifidobacterium crudilactis]MCI1643950.1 ubiquitin-like protein Pup [Bifidobacterium crudilactis]MCI1663970.1 ubiquitin-like protein Pup [Bifidobacterium crudilactis]MCI1868081.1 ubiquitin-like protein Pup [Bifidobacterium crudilactis]